jgi:hypothetical protein
VLGCSSLIFENKFSFQSKNGKMKKPIYLDTIKDVYQPQKQVIVRQTASILCNVLQQAVGRNECRAILR